jgi:hypothetical protein
MQRMEDSSLGQLWRLTNVLFKVRNGALTQKDVKNEGTSGDVYENKWVHDTMPIIDRASWPKMHKFRDNERQSIGLFGRKCTD